MGMVKRYISVSLPEELIEEIDSLVGKMGYRSRPDIISDALRRFFEEMRGRAKGRRIAR